MQCVTDEPKFERIAIPIADRLSRLGSAAVGSRASIFMLRSLSVTRIKFLLSETHKQPTQQQQI